MNTKVGYLYRDRCNNKKYNECIVKGCFSEAQKKKILDCCCEGMGFIPCQVGLPEIRFDEFYLDCEVPWFEIYENDFVVTALKPTVDITAEELVKAFKKAKGKWDTSLWMKDVDYSELLETCAKFKMDEDDFDELD